MKKLLLLLLSVLVMVPTLAQSKREQRETRRSERLEQQRVADPITNKGMEGSALQIGWSEMLKYATYFGKTNITYK